VAFDIEVACGLRDAAGERADQSLELRLEVPVGAMNPARPVGG
jgi:hypothetical protein